MKIFSTNERPPSKWSLKKVNHILLESMVYIAVLSVPVLFAGCNKQNETVPASASPLESKNVATPDNEVINRYRGINVRTLFELREARSATAKYRNINKAFADHYADINVVVPNMGYHFMKSELVDSVFDVRHPEILVYNKNLDGEFQLVAVEYAVPISASPDKAPEGFSGPADVWERNTTFGLWLQHAWVWAFNPDGVFHDTNPLIQVH
jgi:hypothetical protein